MYIYLAAADHVGRGSAARHVPQSITNLRFLLGDYFIILLFSPPPLPQFELSRVFTTPRMGGEINPLLDLREGKAEKSRVDIVGLLINLMFNKEIFLKTSNVNLLKS